MYNFCKYTFARHNAVANFFVNFAVGMTELSDLGNLKSYILAAENSSYRQSFKINTLHQQVFAKITVADLASLGTEFLDTFIAQETDMTMPVTCMAVVFQTVILNQFVFPYVDFFGAPLFAYAHGHNTSHVLTLLFVPSFLFP